MSDTTPHESLPLTTAGHRQYFRLVTSSVSAWYTEHSTENPLGIKPDPKVTRSGTGGFGSVLEQNRYQKFIKKGNLFMLKDVGREFGSEVEVDRSDPGSSTATSSRPCQSDWRRKQRGLMSCGMSTRTFGEQNVFANVLP